MEGVDDRVWEAVDIVRVYAENPGNPFKWLYHHPNEVRSVQFFAKWAQKYTGHKQYIALVRASFITGHKLVPAALFYNPQRQGLSGRAAKVGHLTFYFVKQEEMSPRLLRRFNQYEKLLNEEIRKTGIEIKPDNKRVEVTI